jgi:hypothetical protein
MFQFFIRIPNIQMFFVIQHELIVQGKHVVQVGSSRSWNIKSLIFLRVCPSGRSFHIAPVFRCLESLSLQPTPTHYEKTVLNQVSTLSDYYINTSLILVPADLNLFLFTFHLKRLGRVFGHGSGDETN